jgi:hypothetical protein
MKKKELCYFCGDKVTSKDHLPPDNIFPSPKPSNLITFKSCDLHNKEQSMDDEYFGIIIKTASSESPIAKSMIEDKVVRGFKRRPNLLLSMLKRSRYVDIVTPSGIIIDKRPAIEYDRSRINNVVTRMTKGYYYKYTGNRLPDDYSIKVFKINPSLDAVHLELLSRIRLNTIVADVFSLKYQIDKDDPCFSVWFFFFYNLTLLISLTVKNNDNDGN